MAKSAAGLEESQENLHTQKGFYETTRPIIPPTAQREWISTTAESSKGSLQLQLRPFEASHLPDFYKLRTQHEVMKWTSKGTVDVDISETTFWMNRFLSPNDLTCYQFSIFVSKPKDGFEHVGVIGCHIITPIVNIGYMLRQEWWGYGLATASVKAFIQKWWTLDRQVVRLEYGPHIEHSDLEAETLADPQTLQTVVDEVVEKEARVTIGEMKVVPEILFAETVDTNGGSQRVLQKCGFTHRGRTEIEENGETVVLEYFTLTR